jgi:crotonobetainyl-CoA:carnitine CoA-transferase CaiB-like acyl-CoA transferase
MLALEGINVLDLTRGGPGPFCTMVLADLGADVIRVGPTPSAAKGESGAEGQAITARRSAAYRPYNRNKKSIGLNLKAEEGRGIFFHLAKKADVVVEGFRPGVARRMGIDYLALSKKNPGIVYCSITGYGQDGPYSQMPGHDINYIAFAGLLDLFGEKGGRPVVPLNLISDIGSGGMNAIIGILSALLARTRTGRGQYIDIALLDSAISLLPGAVTDYFRGKPAPKRGETLFSGGYPYYSIYETKDGKYISIGCNEPWLWANLCRGIGKEEFIPFHYEPEHTYQPAADKKWQEISSHLRQHFLTRTRDEWFDLLSQKDIPIAKVYSLDETFADPQVLHREMVMEAEHPTEGQVKQVGIAIKLSETPGAIRGLPKGVGEDTEEVLASLGYDRQKIYSLRQEGIVC